MFENYDFNKATEEEILEIKAKCDEILSNRHNEKITKLKETFLKTWEELEKENVFLAYHGANFSSDWIDSYTDECEDFTVYSTEVYFD